MNTKFETIYNRFFSKVTDDMYMELDKNQTEGMVEELHISAIPWFEFPRVDLYNFNKEEKTYNIELSNEEVNIIAVYMLVEWLTQQLVSVENTRMKCSGSDFKFTSQANHMSKLLALKKDYEREGFHLQRLYKRRKTDKNGITKSTFGSIMGNNIQTTVSEDSHKCGIDWDIYNSSKRG